MENERLTYFTTVVEEGSISAAARRLHLSQPPVSLQIQNLEAEYGVKLLNRSGQGVQLTEAGKILYDYACRINELEAEAHEDINELHSGHRGKIRMGIISSGTCNAFIQGLRAYHRASPAVRFSIFDGNTYQMLDELQKQRIDMAVVRTPFSRKGLDILELQKDTFLAAGKEEFMKGLNSEITLNDLSDRPLILYRRWERILQDAFEKNNLEADIICINDDVRTCIQWAQAGMGIALVPGSVLPLLEHLQKASLKEPSLNSTICLVRKNGYTINESAAAFWNIFAHTKKGNP